MWEEDYQATKLFAHACHINFFLCKKKYPIISNIISLQKFKL